MIGVTEPARWEPRADRLAYGKSLRDRVKRADQARWELPARTAGDVRERLRAAEHGRQPDLLPIKYGKMATSPFAYLRGSAGVMAPDLAAQPSTGYRVQICGDAHARNLGACATADGNIVFDLNDFDESCRAPWEWDLRRLAISLVLAGRESHLDDRTCRDAARGLVAAWRETMLDLVDLPTVELAHYKVKRASEAGTVGRALAKAERVTPTVARDRWTAPDPHGVDRFVDHRVPDEVARDVLASLAAYRETLGPARQLVLEGYRPYDVAFRIQGTGSLGLRNYLVLCRGNGDDDPLILQVKQCVPTCYQALGLVGPDPRVSDHHGKRAAEGQHRMQTHADPLLGWTDIAGVPFLVRQVSDHSASIDLENLSRPALLAYACVCGEAFAKAHARTGDAAIFAGYAGQGDNLDRAFGDLALAGADQVTRDWEILVAAITAGAIRATAPAK